MDALPKLQPAAEKARMNLSGWETRSSQEIETVFGAMGQVNGLGAALMIDDAFFSPFVSASPNSHLAIGFL